jgi:integrase
VTRSSPEQVWKLIDAAREIDRMSYGLTFISPFTGLGRNEPLAVQFDDVDWFNRELRVRHAISNRKATAGATNGSGGWDRRNQRTQLVEFI